MSAAASSPWCQPSTMWVRQESSRPRSPLRTVLMRRCPWRIPSLPPSQEAGSSQSLSTQSSPRSWKEGVRSATPLVTFRVPSKWFQMSEFLGSSPGSSLCLHRSSRQAALEDTAFPGHSDTTTRPGTRGPCPPDRRSWPLPLTRPNPR